MRKVHLAIADMMEDMPTPGNTSVLSGGTTAQVAMTVLPTDSAEETGVEDESGYATAGEPDKFTEEELRITKRFLEIMGSADRAREAVTKVDECEDCLGLIQPEDEECASGDVISQMADVMPTSPELPTGTRRVMDLASLYNPSATVPYPGNY